MTILKILPGPESTLTFCQQRRLRPSWCLAPSSSCSYAPCAVSWRSSFSRTDHVWPVCAWAHSSWRSLGSRRPWRIQSSCQSVLGLILLGVDHGESSRLATTKIGSEAKDEHHVRGGLVHLGQLLPDLSLGDCGPAWMEDIDHHLLPLKQPIGHELSGSERHCVIHLGVGLAQD